MSRATLKDIAAATGVSANTVDLALRGSPRLPEETQQRILVAAQRLNYAPNRIARSRATRMIGLVMTDIMNPTLTLTARTSEDSVSVPGDLALVGYDNIELSLYAAVPLTTVSYAADKVSLLAVAAMLAWIEGREISAPTHVHRIESELLLRASS